jgi:hypothetical protein
VVDGEVREVEEGVAHAGVLPVDDPETPSAVDEVRVQEVVVARAGRDAGAAALDPVGELLRALVGGRHGRAALERRRAIHLDDAEAVEARGQRRASMERRERGADALDRHLADLALDVARDEVALRLDERHDLRREPELRRHARRGVLGRAVDPEQLRVLAADPQHERLVADRDLEVAVRDPAAERLDPRRSARPQPLDDRLGLHRRILGVCAKRT